MSYTVDRITAASNFVNIVQPRWEFCPKDGAKLEAGWKHCPSCGQAIGASLVPDMQTLQQYDQQGASVSTQLCLVEEFFKSNPQGTCCIACPCPKCTVRC